MVLARVAVRELVHVLPAVAREVRVWRTRARAIPDEPTRRDALSALARKRGHTDGAALFWTLSATSSGSLLRLLVAYEIAWDYLDSVNERGADAGQVNGRQLHLALIEALDPNLPVSSYYRYNRWRADGGYLRALVDVCRESCPRLSSFESARPLVSQEARRAQVLAINHDLDAAQRDTALRAWAARECPSGSGSAVWFELTGAASASLTVHVLLALADEVGCEAARLAQAQRAYFPWISALTTMLDSYVDQVEDVANGDHSYVAHYGDGEVAVQRIRYLLDRSLQEARKLDNAEHHILIVTSMVAMYLSKDSARSAPLRANAESIVRAGGSLTKVLLPILRLWRLVYSQRST
jgi:tetraprenyl-beta-curcumene synthase